MIVLPEGTWGVGSGSFVMPCVMVWGSVPEDAFFKTPDRQRLFFGSPT